MTNTPLVSICIASHNYARFLPDALDAALSQTYPNVEVVVVDDGSEDESPEVLARYADRVTLELVAEARGQGAACNRCFDLSSGDIIIFHDSDDVLEPDAVERIVAAFGSPDVTLVLGRLRDIDEHGASLDAVRPTPEPRLDGGDLRRLVAKHANFTWPETTGQSFRRTAIEPFVPMPETFAPDLYLSQLAALAGTVAVIDQPIARYRVHSGNKSTVPLCRGVDWLDMKLVERRAVDRSVREQAARLGLADPPGGDDDSDPMGLPHDHIRAGLEVAARRLKGERRATKWAIEGIRSIAVHPQFRVRSRLRHIAWFAAVMATPPATARRLCLRRYPFASQPAAELLGS
jgi:hypothetical protein